MREDEDTKELETETDKEEKKRMRGTWEYLKSGSPFGEMLTSVGVEGPQIVVMNRANRRKHQRNTLSRLERLVVQELKADKVKRLLKMRRRKK